MPRRDEPQWKDYEKMVTKRAWSFSRSYGVEHEELVGEGALIFVRACRKYDDRRATFSTFLWQCLTKGLLTFCRQQMRQRGYLLTDDGELPEVGDGSCERAERRIVIQQSIAALPAVANAAVCLLAAEPHQLGVSLGEPPRVVCAALRDHMRAQGESWSMVRGSLNQLKQIYLEVQ